MFSFQTLTTAFLIQHCFVLGMMKAKATLLVSSLPPKSGCQNSAHNSDFGSAAAQVFLIPDKCNPRLSEPWPCIPSDHMDFVLHALINFFLNFQVNLQLLSDWFSTQKPCGGYSHKPLLSVVSRKLSSLAQIFLSMRPKLDSTNSKECKKNVGEEDFFRNSNCMATWIK